MSRDHRACAADALLSLRAWPRAVLSGLDPGRSLPKRDTLSGPHPRSPGIAMPGQRGSEQRRRKHIVHVRMDDGELRALDNLIGDCGWSRAAFIRALIATRGDIRIFEVAPLVAALSRIGGNLNQIARQANRNGQIDDAQYLRHALDELIACIRNLEDLTL